MIKNIIFDWSGTLSNDIIPVYKATMTVFDRFGVKRISLEEFRRQFELLYMNIYKKYFPKKLINKEEIDNIFLDALRSIEKPRPFPQAKKTLEFLSGKGIRMAVLSSHPQKRILKEIGDYGYSKFFVYVRGGVYDKTSSILKLMNECGFKREHTAFVGDTVQDIETGKGAKVVTVAVSWGYKPKEELSRANPDFLIEKPNQLEKIVS
jgi:phosphoglycolate phosphatase